MHNGCPLNVNALVEQIETGDTLLLYKYIFFINGSQLVWEATAATTWIIFTTHTWQWRV